MGVATPDHRGPGWGIAAAIEVAAEDRQGPHGVPQVVRWAPKLVPTGEVLEHHDFGFAEPNLGGQFGVSRPSMTMAKSRQAITALMVTARSIRCPSRWWRNSALHPRFRTRCQSSIRQRRRYNSSTRRTSFRVDTGRRVSRIPCRGSTPAGGSSSVLRTAVMGTGSPAPVPFPGGGRSKRRNCRDTLATRASRSAWAFWGRVEVRADGRGCACRLHARRSTVPRTRPRVDGRIALRQRAGTGRPPHASRSTSTASAASGNLHGGWTARR